MKLKSFKGKSDSEGLNVMWMKGDVVGVEEVNEGEVLVVGISGWSTGVELSLSPEDLVDHFEIVTV